MPADNRDRFPFAERRQLILDSLDVLDATFKDMTWDEFMSDWRNRDAASMRLTAIGELMHENAGHASKELSELFYNARTDHAHHYFRVPGAEVWDLLSYTDRLRKEVLERTIPPAPTKRR